MQGGDAHRRPGRPRRRHLRIGTGDGSRGSRRAAGRAADRPEEAGLQPARGPGLPGADRYDDAGGAAGRPADRRRSPDRRRQRRQHPAGDRGPVTVPERRPRSGRAAPAGKLPRWHHQHDDRPDQHLAHRPACLRMDHGVPGLGRAADRWRHVQPRCHHRAGQAACHHAVGTAAADGDPRGCRPAAGLEQPADGAVGLPRGQGRPDHRQDQRFR